MLVSHGRATLWHSAEALLTSNDIACQPRFESALKPIITLANASPVIHITFSARGESMKNRGSFFSRRFQCDLEELLNPLCPLGSNS